MSKLTDDQVSQMTESAFASTNDRGEKGLQMYWYGKGVRDGYELTQHTVVDEPHGQGRFGRVFSGKLVFPEASKAAAVNALVAKWQTRDYGQSSGYLSAVQIVDLVTEALMGKKATE